MKLEGAFCSCPPAETCGLHCRMLEDHDPLTCPNHFCALVREVGYEESGVSVVDRILSFTRIPSA